MWPKIVCFHISLLLLDPSGGRDMNGSPWADLWIKKRMVSPGSLRSGGGGTLEQHCPGELSVMMKRSVSVLPKTMATSHVWLSSP